MKLEILQENLLKGLQVVSRISSSKPQLPILANVLLKTNDGQLQLSVSNLEIFLTTYVGAKIIEEGSYTLPIKTFIDVIMGLPPGKILLNLNDGQMEIISSSVKTKLNGIPSTEWPANSKSDDFQSITIDFSLLKDLVAKVLFCVGFDENRPALTGILFRIIDGKLNLVATDGFRLSLIKTDKIVSQIKDLSVIIPAKVFLEVCRWEGKKTINIEIGNSQVGFLGENNELLARLINANYPPYEKIVPQTYDFEVEFLSNDIVQAVKLAGIFAKDNANIVKMKIIKDKCTISALSSQTGESTSDIEITNKNSEKEEVVVAFNYHYLTDFLLACVDNRVVYRYTTATNPGLFSIVGQDDFLHLIMPVRVEGSN